MLTVTVAQDGSGDFASIAEAVLAVPYEEKALVQVGPGIYREKLVCEKRCITLRGAGADKTKLVWGDGGKLPHKDGRPTHTFRSYTAFFSGETLCVEDMTIENDAGPGAKAGQAVAAYVDSTRAVFHRVKLLGSQDTLFCAPAAPKRSGRRTAFSARAVLRPANRPPSTTPTVRSQVTLISSLAAATPCSKTASSARWTTTSPTAMSQLLRAGQTDLALCSGTAISSPTARRAVSIWGVRGVPKARRRCWTAVSAPTSHRKVLSHGMTAPIPALPALRKLTAPARAQQSARRG